MKLTYILQRNLICKILISLVFLVVPFISSHAQIIDSSFYGWRVYEIQENELDYKKCYILSHPAVSDSDQTSRKTPYLMIARFQKDRSEEISIFGGFEYKLSSKVSLLADKTTFQLLSKGDMAWARTKSEDVEVIAALLNSGVLKVRSDSAIGNYAIDEYSLKGITRAYARMREVCK